MTSKDFGQVDRYKTALADAGVDVRMSKEGIELIPRTDFSSEKLWSIERNRDAE
jgi:cysteinyl-tRNA synthetase